MSTRQQVSLLLPFQSIYVQSKGLVEFAMCVYYPPIEYDVMEKSSNAQEKFMESCGKIDGVKQKDKSLV